MDKSLIKRADVKEILRTESGFTLIEVILVMVIIVILASVVMPKFTNRSKDAKISAASADIANMEVALDAFEVDTGRYPTTSEDLDALVEPPNNIMNWKGPYIKRGVPNDPWGTPYDYSQPGKNNSYGYDLFSYGPDMREAGDDDIDNWSMSSVRTR